MLLVMSCDQHILLDGEMFSFQPVCETPASKNLGPSNIIAIDLWVSRDLAAQPELPPQSLDTCNNSLHKIHRPG